MEATFGATLKKYRLEAGIGLSRFAAWIDEVPSKLCAMEHGRRAAPTDPGRLREIAEALGLVQDSDKWNDFFDAAWRKE